MNEADFAGLFSAFMTLNSSGMLKSSKIVAFVEKSET